jgi:hypothetical protein
MAKIKLGAIVVDMRGKLGGHVFAQNKGGNYVRTKTTPTNPQTASQNAVRSIFADISTSWSGLTEVQRESFNSVVPAYAKTNVFGDLKIPSGKALYQRLNQNLGIVGEDFINTAVNPLPIQTATIDGVDGIVSNQSMEVELSGDCTGSNVCIYATPPMSQGTKFVKNKLRLIHTFAGGDDSVEGFDGSYITKFGNITLGNNIVIGIRFINANGQASPMQTQKMVIIATP